MWNKLPFLLLSAGFLWNFSRPTPAQAEDDGEPALQDHAPELQGQELKQLQAKIQELMNRLAADPQAVTSTGSFAATDMDPQELQKLLRELQQQMNKLQEDQSHLDAWEPEDAAQPTTSSIDSSPTRKNAQSPEMQRMFNDLRRRGGQ